ncbi:helix-turn-helix domain-containing protein [Aquimarina algiphila]|uniref:helix-turn-helix domain-containing protein n=1 Tax=Aquimarina algiphila TaxID=2047982 RepID=UPI0024904BAB|nr:AraC family transcriptional regulator [Aquimarina algiphila]
MLKEYSISEIIISNSQKEPYYIGTFEDTEAKDVDWPHRHNFFSIVWFTDSTGINVIDFDEYKIKPDRIFLMQPKQVHNWSYSKGSKGFTLVIANHLINKEIIDLFNIVFIDLPLEAKSHLKILFNNLIKEFNKNDKLSETIVISGIYYLINQLKRFALELKFNEKVKPETALKFSKLVLETLSQNLSINDYANRLNITTERLVEICQKSYGQSPKAIILAKKITEAKRLLYFTNKSVSEVAYQLGFTDSSYFSRLFKQKTKLSPSDFKST